MHLSSAMCNHARMKISTTKTMAIVFLQKPKALHTASKRQSPATCREVQIPWGGIYKWYKVEQGN